MPIYVYKGNNQVSTNAIRNDKVVKAIYAKEQGKDAVCVWGIDTSIPYDQMFTYSIVDNTIKITGLKPEVKTVYITIPNKISNKSVTKIADGAFTDKNKIKEMTIPNNVTSIGFAAFDGCSSLESITIPFVGDRAGITGSDTNRYPFGYIFGKSSYTGGVATEQFYYEAHANTPKSTTYYIPSSLKSVTVSDENILDSAFYNCSGLTSITIGNGVKIIGNDAFYNCTGLTSVKIGNGVTGIGDFAFRNCTGLTSITIPNSVTSIGHSVFRGCESLTNVVISNRVPSIGLEFFAGCRSLTSITIPNSVTSIGRSAFLNCSSLTSVTLTDNVTNIGERAFSGCSSIESITIPFIGAKAGVTSSDKNQYPFGYIFGTSSYTGGVATTQYYHGDSTTSPTSTTYYIPSSLKYVTITKASILLYGAFYNCNGLTTITLPNSIEVIQDYVFYNCTGLIDIIFNGTKAQWYAIVKTSLWDDNTGNYTIHCTDGDIPKQ